MKKDIHPNYNETTITCNGCNNSFKTRATVDKIEVEICSQCHPFYTGKQKLVDVAGRVDRFRAKQAAASKKSEEKTKSTKSKAAKSSNEGKKQPATKKSLAELKD